MGLKSSITTISLVLLLFSGCSKTNYISKSETPEDLNGFLGFRWSTPMDIVDDQLLQLTSAESVSHLDAPKTVAYSKIGFLGRKSSLCQFFFDWKGLSATKLIFISSTSSISADLKYFRDKLTMIYGIPVQMTKPAYQKEYRDYIEGYYWFYGRLSLILKPGHQIVINAFREKCPPPDAPPFPPSTTRQYAGPVF